MNSSDQPLLANQLPISIEFPKELNGLVETVTNTYKRIASSVNTKEGALYVPQEISTFQQYFTSNNPQVFRAVYRKVIDFGALPNTGTKTMPHGISCTDVFSVTRIYGAATDPSGTFHFIPLPFSSPDITKNISLEADNTDIIITTGMDRTPYTRCTVVFEYVKNQ